MPNYRIAPHGMVNAELTDVELSNIFKNLNLLRKDAYSDFELVIGGHVGIETLRAGGQLIGGSFREFMEANYDSGKGPLANLVKDIVHFLNGRIGHQSIVTSIKIEEQKLQSANRVRSAIYSPSKRTGSSLPLLEDGYVVHDFDFYNLMAGISPANVGRFLQLLGGESYYV